MASWHEEEVANTQHHNHNHSHIHSHSHAPGQISDYRIPELGQSRSSTDDKATLVNSGVVSGPPITSKDNGREGSFAHSISISIPYAHTNMSTNISSQTEPCPSSSQGPLSPGSTAYSSQTRETQHTKPVPIHYAQSSPSSNIPIKRGRGRPRKHPGPIQMAGAMSKGTRSKAGCSTCRKRKKKCDETKPRCLNCHKTAVTCLGYDSTRIWTPGPSKTRRGSSKDNDVDFKLPPLFPGCDSSEDKILYSHYFMRLSSVLTVEGELHNAFIMHIIPMTVYNEMLMHCMLYLSSVHFDTDTPDGQKAMAEYPSVTLESMQARSDFHLNEIKVRTMEGRDHNNADSSYGNDSIQYMECKYSQCVCLLVSTRANGARNGFHRVHLMQYLELRNKYEMSSLDFQSFILEFFQYHIFADLLMWHPKREAFRMPPGGSNYPMPSELINERLIGVGDGLLAHLAEINGMRDSVREQVMAGYMALTNTYSYAWEAFRIGDVMDNWLPNFLTGDCRDNVVKIYKTAMWVYLKRTLDPPRPIKATRMLIEREQYGVSSLPLSPGSIASAYLSVPPLFYPPTAPSTTWYSSGVFSPAGSISLPSSAVGYDGSVPVTPPLASSIVGLVMRNDDGSEAGSSLYHSVSLVHGFGQQSPVQTTGLLANPFAIHRESFDYDVNVMKMVDKALELIGNVRPSDPAQTLLLMPCLMVGVSALKTEQQDKVTAAVRVIRGYTGMKNCDLVSQLLEEVWKRMGRGDWWGVWDWQQVAVEMGLDFIAA